MLENEKTVEKLVLQYQYLLGLGLKADTSMEMTLNLFRIHRKTYREETSKQILDTIAGKENQKSTLEIPSAPTKSLVTDQSSLKRFQRNPVMEDLGFYPEAA